jgi:hypothetical protein
MPIYNFKLSKEIKKGLNKFAEENKHLEKYIFDYKWKRWLENNKITLDNENEVLKSKGYEKNLYDKLYFSVRYYYVKKAKEKEKEKVKVKLKYVPMTLKLRDLIEKHLREHINVQPKLSFELFLQNETNKSKYNEMVDILLYNEYSEKDAIKRIKKAYKNRYCILIK